MSEVIGDRYRLDAELGAGGTATVWLAHDLALDRVCAVKVLLPVQGAAAQARRDRLRTEARALARLQHPHVVRIFDLGQEDDRDYIVMEYVEGGSLADRLEADGAWAPARAARVGLQVLDALATAHDAGIVHRDVKPGNILMRDDGTAALADFGIARQEGGQTATGVMLGSVGYMAPEQRLDARKVAPAADLYGVGCTLFNLVTNDTPVDLYLAADHSPRWEAVPRPLLAVIRRATQADPERRYHSAPEMAAALEEVLPALRGLPAAVRDHTSEDHPRTVAEGPALSVDAGVRQRHVHEEDWGWSAQRSALRPGRTALWIGVVAVAAVGLVATVAQPMIEANLTDGPPTGEAEAEAAEPAVLRESPVGMWFGNFDGNNAVLELTGTPDDLTGELRLRLGSHDRRSTVRGRWVAEEGRLELRDVRGAPGAGSYVGVLEADGLVLRGEFTRADGGAVVRFALVPVE
jgi:hypothetical protein